MYCNWEERNFKEKQKDYLEQLLGVMISWEILKFSWKHLSLIVKNAFEYGFTLLHLQKYKRYLEIKVAEAATGGVL